MEPLDESQVQARAVKIRLVVFDVDRVLTDGRLYLGDSGEEYKVFHVRDGQGLVMLRDSGVRIAVISGRSSRAVAERMVELGIDYVFQGQADKLGVFEALLNDVGLEPTEVAYVGDDLPDLPVMRQVGLAIAVADAHPWVKQHAHWQTRLPGGQGAVREVCELLMEAQGMLASYSCAVAKTRL
ncbi:MAG TPA: 3-deoxy-manno-octulosonate-8-phosphatase KdsC [Gammaproteobacteria bacterium]|nr:3-deoxy-manno-octulosonate-8-phosphatase KdsC [Gammaproteobacteria bacterium]